MKHTEVLEIFKKTLPDYAKYLKEWFPNGRNEIRVRLLDMRQFIFVYNSEEDWMFETLDRYIAQMRELFDE